MENEKEIRLPGIKLKVGKNWGILFYFTEMSCMSDLIAEIYYFYKCCFLLM